MPFVKHILVGSPSKRQIPGAEHPLSPSEHEVLELLSKEPIADMPGVNIETDRKHLHNIYESLQVNSRTEAGVKYLGR